jgi:hypothetical protein
MLADIVQINCLDSIDRISKIKDESGIVPHDFHLRLSIRDVSGVAGFPLESFRSYHY